MKRYQVKRLENGDVICLVYPEVKKFLDPIVKHLEHVIFHSPTGFETGYAGSGPADLALSIMADYFGATPENTLKRIHGFSGDGGPEANGAVRFYQDFKDAFIAPRHLDPGNSYSIEKSEIDEWFVLEAETLSQLR